MPIYGEWSNPALRRCLNKAAYGSWHLAEDKAQKASLKTGDLIIAYECYDCGEFHIGHADHSQHIVRQVALSSVNSQCPRCHAQFRMNAGTRRRKVETPPSTVL